MGKIASIDIGTNTVLLTVAEWDGKNIKILADEARITRLGQGLNRDPNFLPEAQERVLTVLKDYKKIASDLGTKKVLAVGTAAFRKAKNAAAFVDRVLRETGIPIRIISGEEEARLSYLSAHRDFGDSDNLFVLDIGGGSTEVITKSGGVSMDLGAVVLSESIIKHDPPTANEIVTMEKEIDRVLNQVRRTVALKDDFVEGEDTLKATAKRYPKGARAPLMVGLAGSVTTLSAIQQKLTVWDGARVQGSVLTMKEIDDLIALFRRTTNAEKSKIPGMVKGREDTILAGTLILRSVMRTLGVDRVTVSDRGLRFGLIYESA